MPGFLLRAGLQDKPKLAEELGHLSVVWAAVEFRIFWVFKSLTGITNPIARSIFYSQRTTRARIEITMAVAHIVLRKRRGSGHTAEFNKLKKLLGNIGTLAGGRNKYIHDPWTGYPNPNKSTFQLRLDNRDMQGGYERISPTQVKKLTIKIESKLIQLRRFHEGLEQKLPPLHKRLAQQPDLYLVPATTDIRPKKKKAKPQRQRRSSGARP